MTNDPKLREAFGLDPEGGKLTHTGTVLATKVLRLLQSESEKLHPGEPAAALTCAAVAVTMAGASLRQSMPSDDIRTGWDKMVDLVNQHVAEVAARKEKRK